MNPVSQLKQSIALSLLFISTCTALYAQEQVEEVLLDLKFADPDGFENYKNDEERSSLAPPREKAIARTSL
ncbi:MAG: hypothetical protein WDZ52_01730 [Pseudohongiellaceae bacterium]